MKTKLSALIMLLALLPSCLLINYDLISNLNLDYNWYCNIFGIPVIDGSIVNKNDTTISGVKLNVKLTYSDGSSHTQTITLNDDIAAGGRSTFKKWLSNPNDEQPQSISVTIIDAW
jgi:hypothetical protein